MNSTYKIGFYTAISLVIANMIGTGVFTSLGFQLFDIHSVFSILVLWLLGGIISFCGAFTCIGDQLYDAVLRGAR